MKFIRKRWHGVPIAILLAVLVTVLAAGSAAAVYAYPFLSVQVAVFVDEPLTVEYNLQGNYGGDSSWHLLGDLDSQTLERSAGDDFDMDVRVTNDADNALTVNTAVTGTGAGWFTFAGWPDGAADNCAPGQTTFNVSMDVAGNAPAPLTYNLTFAFTRE